MKKLFITISLLILCFALARPVDARLTLGVVVGEEGPGKLQRDQVESLAGQLYGALQEEIVVKELADSAAVVNWLDQFAAIDLALLSAADISTYRGRLLLIGPLDKEGRVNLVARQGVSPDLAQRAAELVRQTGFSPWRSIDEAGRPHEPVAAAPPLVDEKSLTIDAVIEAVEPPAEAKIDLSSVKVTPFPDTQVKAARQVDQTISLAVIQELQSTIHSTDQAEQMSTYLERTLPIEVKVKEFFKVENFVEWFMRFRMVDYAVVSKDVAEARLGRDYIAIIEIVPSGKDMASPELLIGRRGHNTALQEQLQQVLLETQQTADGQELLAKLGVDFFNQPEGGLAARPARDQVVELPMVSEKPVVKAAEQPVDEPTRVVSEEQPTAEIPEPIEPLPPPELVVAGLPSIPEVAIAELPPEPAVPDLVPAVPAPEEAPTAPEQLGSMPEISLPQSPAETSEPEVIERPVFAGVPIVDEAPQIPSPPVEVTSPELPVTPERIEVPLVAKGIEPQVEPVEMSVTPPEPVAEPEVALAEDLPEAVEEEQIIEEVLEFAEPVSPQDAEQIRPVVVSEEDFKDQDILELLGEDSVAALVSQPDIPQELRPPGVPIVRPGRLPKEEPAIDEGLFLTALPDPIPVKEPEPLPKLLPDPEPEPGVVYIVPFVAVMVPKVVNDRIFDKFVDALLAQSDKLSLQFVILKDGLQRVDPDWLSVRKYVTGEIYAYVEEAGSTAIDLRAKARLNYHKPNLDAPAFSYMHPVSRFLDRNVSTIEKERLLLADNIADALIAEFLTALKN